MKEKLRRFVNFIAGSVAGLLWVVLEVASNCWRAVKRKVKELTQK